MSADARPVTTDALETLGMIITEKEKRDAIHLAVEPVEAGELLYPGQDVGLKDGKAFGLDLVTPLGIVDPFLTKRVMAGDRFWLVIYPRQIHSLRHVWTHPAFPDAPELADLTKPTLTQNAKAKSEEWLRAWCASNDAPNYEEVIAGLMGQGISADKYGDRHGVIHEGEYLISYGSDAHCEIPDEFWHHIKIVTGKTFEHATHFSCSC
jgi:hypothetical protein